MLCGTMAQSPQRRKLTESKSDFCLLIFSHCLIIHSFFLGLVYTEKRCPGQKSHPLLELPWVGEPTFHTFPYRTWRTVYMRNKKLSQQQGGYPIGFSGFGFFF